MIESQALDAATAVAGFVRLPDESLPDSFRKAPAQHVPFVDAVSAVTPERGED